jgi:hypothetical protein
MAEMESAILAPSNMHANTAKQAAQNHQQRPHGAERKPLGRLANIA